MFIYPILKPPILQNGSLLQGGTIELSESDAAPLLAIGVIGLPVAAVEPPAPPEPPATENSPPIESEPEESATQDPEPEPVVEVAEEPSEEVPEEQPTARRRRSS